MSIPENFTILSEDENGEPVILYAPNSEGQAAYHRSTKPNCIMWGNRGGGKSHCGRWDAHVRAMSHPGFTYAILRRTYPELQRTHLIHIDREMKALGGYYNKSEKIAYYPNGSKGFFAYCEGEEDVLKLLSAEFCLMFFDELSTFDWEMFTKLATSCRVPANSGLIAMVRGGTNPLGVSSEEILHYFIDRDVDPEEDDTYDPEDWDAIKVQAEDNVNLDTQQYQKRFAGMPEHVRKAWLEGEFAFENAMFDVKQNIKIWTPGSDEGGGGAAPATTVTIPYHYVDSIPLSRIVEAATIYRAYDHGYFPDPAYCLWIAHLGNRFIVIHEKIWFKTIVKDIAKDIIEETKNLGIHKVVTTYADPTVDVNTGADVRTIKDIFEENGVPIDLSVNSRELYASSIHSALGEEVEPNVPRIQFYTKGAPYLCKTLPKQRYDPKHPLRMANSKTDHAAIALAYFLISSGAMEMKSSRPDGRLRPWMKPKQGERVVLGRDNVKDYYR